MHYSFKILEIKNKDGFAKRVKTSMYNAIHFCLYSLLLTLYSCRGDEVIYPTIGTHVTNEVREGGLYVLCEGNMGSNKARLDYINLEMNRRLGMVWHPGRTQSKAAQALVQLMQSSSLPL